MLPNGSQVQTSGYHASTKWLLVGSSEQSIKYQAIIYYTVVPDDVTTYKSIKEFKSTWDESLQLEKRSGLISDTQIIEAAIDIDTSRKADRMIFAKSSEEQTDNAVN